jgi:hypothetical protein
MRCILGLVLVLLVVSSAAADDGWRQWSDPDETVTLDVPRTWRAGKVRAQGDGRVVRFAIPGGGEMTLSIAPGLRRPGELPASIVKPYFPADAVFDGPSTSRGKGWLGLRQEAKSSAAGSDRAWLGQFYAFGTTLVALTLGDDPQRIDAHRADFERIVTSVKYHEPPVDTVLRERGVGGAAARAG